MHLYISLGFHAFQSVFFTVIYDLWIIHSRYFISGFGPGNKMIDLLCSHIGIVQVAINYLLFYRYILCFTMAMPFNMILILYVIPCKLSCDFSKLTILYIHVHIFIFMTNKSVMTFLYVNKISVCLYEVNITDNRDFIVFSRFSQQIRVAIIIII